MSVIDCRFSETAPGKNRCFVADISVLRNNARADLSQHEEISKMMKNWMKVSATVAVFGLLAGCASQDAIEQAQTTADNAARDAAAARSAAEAARASADSASQAAAAAQRTADQALAAAREAQSCCDANRDRLERMFQRGMQK